MKMVASAKLHKAQGAIENMLPYQKKLNKILTNFLSADLPIESPYVKEREVKRVAIVAFSSNTSLCGAFNANVIKMLLQTVGEYRTLGQDNILIFPIGKKVDEAVKRMGFQPQETSPTLSDKPTYQEAADLAHRLMGMFVSGELSRGLQNIPFKDIADKFSHMADLFNTQIPIILPQITEITTNLNRLLNNNSRLSTEALTNFNRTLIEVGAAARSFRDLSDYLERHPEALLRGKGE